MKYMLILFLIVLLFSIYFQFYRKNIIFYSKGKACKIFKKSKYFDNFSDKDLETRNILNKDKNEILQYYCSNLDNFSYNDKVSICWIIDKINKNLKKNKFLSQIWYFCTFKNLEYDFPHTHNYCIFLPRMFIDEINASYSQNLPLRKMKNLINTLIHEKVHVFQRSHKYLFEKLYLKWNFIKGEIIDPYDYKENIRNNPDSYASNYVFVNNGEYILMNAIFRKNSKNIGEIDNLGIYLKKIGKNTFITTKNTEKLKNLKSYNEFFGDIHNNYYEPNEISAELLSYYYLEKLGFDIEYNSKAFSILKNWVKQYIR